MKMSMTRRRAANVVATYGIPPHLLYWFGTPHSKYSSLFVNPANLLIKNGVVQATLEDRNSANKEREL